MVLYVQDGNKFFDDQLLLNIYNGNYDEVLAILKNVDVKYLTDSSGMTLLHHSVLAGNAQIVKYLTKKRCKVNIVDLQGNTPLMIAVMHGYESIVESLLEAKASVFIYNQDNQTPLSISLAPQLVCYPRIISMFFDVLKKECSSNSRRLAGLLMKVRCPFSRVMYFEDILITECMLDAGCTVHDRDPENDCTALHYAVKFHDVNNVKFLLERGADINAEDKSQRKPIHSYESQMLPAHEILTILLEHGAVLDTHMKHDYNLAGWVLQRGDINEVRALLLFNIDLNARNAEGKSLLSFAVKNTNDGVMELLEGREIDVNIMDDQRRTALWYAIRATNMPAVIFLLSKGANPNDGLDALSTGLFRSQHPENNVSLNQWRIKCLESLLQRGLNLLSVDVNQKTIFEIAFEEKNLKLLTPVVEYVAMIIALGRHIDQRILAKIQSHPIVAEYSYQCRQIMEQLKGTVVHNPNVTLFNFLMETKKQLLEYAKDTDTVNKMKSIVRNKRNSNFRFIENLHNCLEDIIIIADLRKKAALKLSKICKLQRNWGVIDRIVMFLDRHSLENVCQI